MKILCGLFGHKAPVYAEKGWWSPGQEYARVDSDLQVDGTGRVHAKVNAKCPRCGEEYKICRIHLPDVRVAKINGYWEFLKETEK